MSQLNSPASATDSATRRGPGRPRREGADHAILEATLAVLTEHGFEGLSMDAVAAKAGVGKATIYRRWASREALVLDAFRELIVPVDIPDTGSVRGDLTAMYTTFSVVGAMTNEALPHLVAAAKVRPELREPLLEYVRCRRQPVRLVFQRAVQRGELPDSTDVELIMDMLSGSLYYRMHMSGGPLDESVVAKLIDMALAAAPLSAAAATTR
jgi:AcrR family transcriptional regulator